MRRLSAFVFVTLDGYFSGPGGDISWHRHGAEEGEYSAESLRSGNTLLFGRVTYQLMASYWPTPLAKQNDPIVARGMNDAEKVVFSRTLAKADWAGTTLVKGSLEEEVRKLKKSSGKEMTLLGSGSILTQLVRHGLVDEVQIMVDPVVLGTGTSLFAGIGRKLDLKLTSTRTFKSGVVLHGYQPI